MIVRKCFSHCLRLIFFICVIGSIYVVYNRAQCFFTSTERAELPNIMWHIPPKSTLNLTHGPDSKEIIFCPVKGRKSVACNFYTRGDNVTDIGAYIMYGVSFAVFPRFRNSNILWGLIYEEAPRANLIFMSDKFLELFNFSATFSRYSDVPYPLIYFQAYKRHLDQEDELLKPITSKRYFVSTTVKNYHLNEISPVIYLQSNPLTFNDRDKYVQKLMEYINVDCYGNSVNNRKLPKELENHDEREDRVYKTRDSEYLHFSAKYKFQIAIESAECGDYISEKLWRPIEQGIVPIYYGSPTVRDWLPNKKTAILIEDFATPELLAKYLHELNNNDTKYEEHLEHKTKGLISNEKLINEFKARPDQLYFHKCIDKLKCVLCQRLHEVNSSKINMVSRKARDCDMPRSLLTRAYDLNNTYMKAINEAISVADKMYDNYVKDIPLDNALRYALFNFKKKPNSTVV